MPLLLLLLLEVDELPFAHSISEHLRIFENLVEHLCSLTFPAYKHISHVYMRLYHFI